MKKTAKDFYEQGYSCSEAVVKSAIVKGLVKEDLLRVATVFSGGMSSGCLCGAVAGAQMVIGALKGRDKLDENSMECREYAKKVVDEFKAKNKFTCCNALSAKYKNDPVARRQNCAKLVEEAAEILEKLVMSEKAEEVGA